MVVGYEKVEKEIYDCASQKKKKIYDCDSQKKENKCFAHAYKMQYNNYFDQLNHQNSLKMYLL